MINFLICTVLPSGTSIVDQTHKFDDFLNLIQLFPITPYSVLVRIKVVRNYVMNNFKLYDKLSRMHSFHSKSLWSWQNSAFSQKKSFFCQLKRLLVGKRCIFGSWLCYSKLFTMSFLTTSSPIKILYNQIWNICEICQILEFFESGKFWRLLGGERCILKGWSWRSILLKIPYLTTFISTKTLYNQIWNICEIC